MGSNTRWAPATTATVLLLLACGSGGGADGADPASGQATVDRVASALADSRAPGGRATGAASEEASEWLAQPAHLRPSGLMSERIEALGLAEVEGLRGRGSKTFVAPDGAYHGFFFGSAIHYPGPGERWKDVDTTVRRLDAAHYGVEANTYTVRFPAEPGGDLAAARLRLPEGGEIDYRVSAITAGDRRWTAGDVETRAAASGDRMTYELAELGVDLRYTVFQNRLKEDVIVHPGSPLTRECASGDLKLDFVVEAAGGGPLSLPGDESRDGPHSLDRRLPVQVYGGGRFNVEPVIAEAESEDGGSTRSLDVHGLAEIEEGRLLLRVTMSCETLGEAAAKGETVLIDPTLEINPIETTFIAENYADRDFCDGTVGGNPYLLAGYHNRMWPARSYHTSMAFLQFSVPSQVCADNMSTGILSIDRERQTEDLGIWVGRSQCTWTICPNMTWESAEGICRTGELANVFSGTLNLSSIPAGTGRVDLEAFNSVRSIAGAGGNRVLVVEGPLSGSGNQAVSFYSDLASWAHRPFLHVVWTQSCTPGETQTEECGDCGTRSRTCTPDGCSWGEWTSCSGEGSCSPGATRDCGDCGIQTCGGDCEWEPCTGEGECSPGDTVPCGDCGTRTCSAGCEWGACEGEGPCTPGDTDTRACGPEDICVQERVCESSCQWSAWDECVCSACPGPDEEPCGDCGRRTRQCSDPPSWGDWGPCEPDPSRACDAGESCGADGWCVAVPCPDGGVCEPGTTRRCDDGGIQECDDSCQWGSCEGGEPAGPGTDGGCCSVASTSSSGSAWMLVLVVIFAGLRARTRQGAPLIGRT